MASVRRQVVQREEPALEQGLSEPVADTVRADGVTMRVVARPAQNGNAVGRDGGRGATGEADRPGGGKSATSRKSAASGRSAKSGISGKSGASGAGETSAEAQGSGMAAIAANPSVETASLKPGPRGAKANGARHPIAAGQATGKAAPSPGAEGSAGGSAVPKPAAAVARAPRAKRAKTPPAPTAPPEAKLPPAPLVPVAPRSPEDAEPALAEPPAGLAASGSRSKALFILDMHTFDEMHAGEIPIIPYSHDRNVLLLAHVVARRNIELFVCCGPDGARERKYRRVARVYPRWEFTREFAADPQDIMFDLVVCAGIEALIMRNEFPEAKLVGILPALHMFEAPGLFRPKFVFDFIQSLRNQIDFIITQNARMREAIVFICHWLARWDPGDRVFEARLGLSRDMESVHDVDSVAYRSQRADGRRRLRLGEDDVLIVNAGGAWNWTDCDTFMEAVCQHWRQRQQHGGSRVRVYFSGITQPDNHEINRVRDRILELLVQYPDCFSNEMGDGRPIYIERDWSRGGRDIHTFLQAGDLGLSVNKVGFEGWQSHRVRIVDYIGAGLPLLAAGDDLLTQEFCRAPFRATPGSIDSYLRIFAAIDGDGAPSMAALKRQVVDDHRAVLDGDVIYGRVIDRIMQTPRRSPDSIAGLERNFLELIQQQSEDRLRDEVQLKLRKMLDL